VSLGPHGPSLVTSNADGRRVLGDTEAFSFPVDVSRRAATGPQPPLPRLRPDQVAAGLATFEAELSPVTGAWDRGEVADAMQVLRLPVARSTTEAVLGPLATEQRDAVADLVLAWVDALGPVIAAARPPRRWSRTRRAERAARTDLEDALRALRVEAPGTSAVELAAGVQVPVAAGAWLLVLLAEHPDADRSDPTAVAWEVLRLRPPTWVTARMSTREVALEHGTVPAHRVVLVSPLLLGQDPAHVPPGTADPEVFDPARWSGSDARPGGWLPFGAGPHACPGRSLGLAQLVALARWGASRRIQVVEPVAIDQTRGIFPRPARLTCEPIPLPQE
jgi:cytochrome P450